MTHFRHCETFSQLFLRPPPRGLIMAPAVGCYACGYCFDLMQCGMILWQCIKIRYSLARFRYEPTAM